MVAGFPRSSLLCGTSLHFRVLSRASRRRMFGLIPSPRGTAVSLRDATQAQLPPETPRYPLGRLIYEGSKLFWRTGESLRIAMHEVIASEFRMHLLHRNVRQYIGHDLFAFLLPKSPVNFAKHLSAGPRRLPLPSTFVI